MNDRELRAVFGLKYNPFLPDIPSHAIWPLPGVDTFLRRIDTLVREGGFALITGDPGLGKSKTLQLVAQHLGRIPDLTVGVMERPQSQLADFYREMGELFGVSLTPLNRYGGFKTLRTRWKVHCQSTLARPVLLIDEAQEVSTACLTELRLLQSAGFDSQSLLFTILCGDNRLPQRFRCAELMPLGSRIQVRLQLGPLPPDQLEEYINFALEQAGHPRLMTQQLTQTLVAHSLNNLRVLNHTAAEMLSAAAEKNLPHLDESLFFELFTPAPAKTRRLKSPAPSPLT
jgi:general secretion pathway protein A